MYYSQQSIFGAFAVLHCNLALSAPTNSPVATPTICGYCGTRAGNAEYMAHSNGTFEVELQHVNNFIKSIDGRYRWAYKEYNGHIKSTTSINVRYSSVCEGYKGK